MPASPRSGTGQRVRDDQQASMGRSRTDKRAGYSQRRLSEALGLFTRIFSGPGRPEGRGASAAPNIHRDRLGTPPSWFGPFSIGDGTAFGWVAAGNSGPGPVTGRSERVGPKGPDAPRSAGGIVESALDTRKKIVEPNALRDLRGRIHVAKGWFDVLTAEHCRLLTDARSGCDTLVVLVYRETALRHAPMDSYGRAQMVAALASVDWVCECSATGAEPIARMLSPASVVDVDAVQKRDVVRDVMQRHGRA